MKLMNRFTPIAGLLTFALCANLHAAEPKEAQPVVVQKTFPSPDDAVKALLVAAEARDTTALHEIFGPEFKDLLTGDKVLDANNAAKFATQIGLGINPVKDSDDKITLEAGTDNWPMPIPLVKTDGQWHFDTAAGKEEIINRHIGKDELCAIGVCQAFVKAEQQYAAMNPAPGGGLKYAQQFKSTEGKKDGLYWPADQSGATSPFGPLVADALAEGYGHKIGSGTHPFHGYYFRMLTQQGEAAPGGKMNYLVHGDLTGGFALVAFPDKWDQSGVMTFIVNQDGKVY